MKVLLYTEGLKAVGKSGLGKAIQHQQKALELEGIDYTLDPKDDFDILHINFYGPKSYLFAKKARQKGKKIVYHAHSTEEDFRNSFLFSNLVSPLFKKWLCKCYRLGDQIITPTVYSKRLLENYNLNRPIHAISNGVETKFFERNEKAGAEFRKTYGYTNSDKIIVGIGLYIERKGILDFVELAKRLPQYKFIWFGYSPLWASPRKIKKAVTTKLPNLHFAGYVESSMIKAALSGANLYLFPTLEETEGIPIIEALTSKIPTLIRDIPVFEEYGDKKVVYKGKNVDEFEDLIPKIIEGELPNLAQAGYRVAQKKDLKMVGKELVNVYEETLKMKRIDEKNNEDNIHKKQVFRTYSIFLAAFIAVIAILFQVKDTDFKNLLLKKYSNTIEYMDTEIKIDLYTTSKSKAERAFEDIENIYAKYDRLTSREEGGTLYEINNNTSKNKYIEIDPDLYEMLQYGLTWYDQSDGLFNINIGDLTDLWAKYRHNKKGTPTKEELANVSVNINDLQLLGNNRIANNHPNIDLDIFKKGYATDKVVEYLKEENINEYLINVGGTICTGDYYKSSGSYLVAVESPFIGDEVELLTSINLRNEAVATAGMYEEYYEYEGKYYSNLINPKTKYPAENMVSATVVADTSAEAEILSYLLFLMPIEDGQKFMSEYHDYKAMWAYVNEKLIKKKVITTNFYDLD